MVGRLTSTGTSRSVAAVMMVTLLLVVVTPLRAGQLPFRAVVVMILPATFDIALILDLAILTASSTATLIVAAFVVMMMMMGVTVMLERLIG